MGPMLDYTKNVSLRPIFFYKFYCNLGTKLKKKLQKKIYIFTLFIIFNIYFNVYNKSLFKIATDD